MTINKFTGKTKEEAIDKAKAEFGSNAVIMNVKEIKPKGLFGMFKSSTYEVTAAMDERNQNQLTGNQPVGGTRAPGKIDYKADEKISLPPLNPSAFDSLIKDKGINPSVKAMDTRSSYTNTESASVAENLSNTNGNVSPNAEEQKRQEAELEKKLDSLANMLEDSFEKTVPRSQNGEELKFVRILYKTLLENEVNEKYINQILEEIEKFLRPGNSMDIILSNVYQKLVLRFGQPDTIKLNGPKPRVVFFVGPTGVGKTTTIAKITSKFKVEQNKKIAFITADTYRIAATDQLRTYANILDSPMSIVYTKEELNNAIAEYEDCDVVFVDTAGFSHKNDTQRNDTKALIAGLSPEYAKDIYLVLSATTKYKDLMSIVDSYKEIGDYKLIFTKLDETSSYGNLLNIKLYSGADISYVTNGQNVPDDIEIFDSQKIVKQLLGGSQ